MLLFDSNELHTWGFWIGIIAALAAIVAAVAAVWALVYAKDAPTKEDLAQVEKNTSHLEEVRSNIERMDKRLHRQEEFEALLTKAREVSIAVNGQDDAGKPLHVYLVLQDPTVVLTRLELFNEVRSVFGSTRCDCVGELTYQAKLDPMMAKRWIGGGTTAQMLNRVRVILRVYMLIGEDKNEVYRDMAVHLTEGMRRIEGTPTQTVGCVIIDGNV